MSKIAPVINRGNLNSEVLIFINVPLIVLPKFCAPFLTVMILH